MYAPLIVAYTLLLIGPPGLTSGQHPVSEQGQTLVFIMSIVAALALGIILRALDLSAFDQGASG